MSIQKEIMIDVKGLSFAYQEKTVLSDVSFQVRKNAVVALVGPNGAGKTTLMRCIAGLHAPITGKVYVNNIDVFDNPRAVHRKLGYLSDFFGLYEQLTIKQCLLHAAGCQNIPKERQTDRVNQVAQQLGLVNRMNEKASSLSRGYRQRLGIGLAIIHQPEILILDEPASGMDPEARIELSQLMNLLKKQGMTILVSSHILAELEDYCTDMLVIRDGKVLDHVQYKEKEEQEKLNIALRVTKPLKKYITMITKMENVKSINDANDEFTITLNGTENDAVKLLKAITEQDIPVIGFEIKKKSLQSTYMDMAKENQDKQEQKP